MSLPLRTLLLTAGLTILAGCTSKPVVTVEQNVPAIHTGAAIDTQRAIVSALGKRGWQVQQVSSNQVLAEITLRGRHHAEITIPYRPDHYTIQYRSSWGLDYKNGKIHRNYNRWVNNLNSSILRELQSQPVSKL
ncbi:hypothetical protein D3880_20445 [Pseudomonas cavernae]|uniref:Lipoprotein n=1 Tax=Pseudomonas cavernae TaxID=2320867 RepID=A0A385Z8V8_9PSED|nr:hypothetical protein [Pseudomonas cavernae]AYC34597.1 hypothetical protein D3880_20445 [Pseudomonas cavernae]